MTTEDTLPSTESGVQTAAPNSTENPVPSLMERMFAAIGNRTPDAAFALLNEHVVSQMTRTTPDMDLGRQDVIDSIRETSSQLTARNLSVGYSWVNTNPITVDLGPQGPLPMHIAVYLCEDAGILKTATAEHPDRVLQYDKVLYLGATVLGMDTLVQFYEFPPNDPEASQKEWVDRMHDFLGMIDQQRWDEIDKLLYVGDKTHVFFLLTEWGESLRKGPFLERLKREQAKVTHSKRIYEAGFSTAGTIVLVSTEYKTVAAADGQSEDVIEKNIDIFGLMGLDDELESFDAFSGEPWTISQWIRMTSAVTSGARA